MADECTPQASTESLAGQAPPTLVVPGDAQTGASSGSHPPPAPSSHANTGMYIKSIHVRNT